VTAGDVMSSPSLTIDSAMPIEQAAELMRTIASACSPSSLTVFWPAHSCAPT
jgi:hypothetical protein